MSNTNENTKTLDYQNGLQLTVETINIGRFDVFIVKKNKKKFLISVTTEELAERIAGLYAKAYSSGVRKGAKTIQSILQATLQATNNIISNNS